MTQRDGPAEQEFEDFLRREGPALLRFARLLSGDPVAGEDLLQEALTNTYAHWARARRHDPAAYVRRAVINGRTSTWRRRRRETVMPQEYDPAGTGDPFGNVDERLHLLAALTQLAERQRVTLVLRYLEGWEDAAIAQALGVRQTTVRSNALRGLVRLRELLADSGDPPDLTPAPIPLGNRVRARSERWT